VVSTTHRNRTTESPRRFANNCHANGEYILSAHRIETDRFRSAGNARRYRSFGNVRTSPRPMDQLCQNWFSTTAYETTPLAPWQAQPEPTTASSSPTHARRRLRTRTGDHRRDEASVFKKHHHGSTSASSPTSFQNRVAERVSRLVGSKKREPAHESRKNSYRQLP